MKRSYINPISKKRREQIKQEVELCKLLLEKQRGRCTCGALLGWRSSKHEIIYRSQGGSPTDENNCVLLCGVCHDRAHHL